MTSFDKLHKEVFSFTQKIDRAAELGQKEAEFRASEIKRLNAETDEIMEKLAFLHRVRSAFGGGNQQ